MSPMRWVTDFAWVSPDGSVAVIVLEPFLALSQPEATNVLRNVLSRGFVQAAAGNAMPLGLVDGVARYVETPILARQARLGSLVQGQVQSGTLPGWEAIASGTAPGLTPEEQTANAYAMVAFVVERYGVNSLGSLIRSFATDPTLDGSLQVAIGQSAASLAPAWEQFLPRWFASGWRENAVSAFDLTRAEQLFARGAYEAAIAEAERSQRLFSEIGDQASLNEVDVLLAQSSVGLQADGLMQDAQEALDTHDYARAAGFVNQANDLYAVLPAEHRPGRLIETYAALASKGELATTQLADATSNAEGWLRVASARTDAVEAGNAFADLGDQKGVDAANDVVEQIDWRVNRIRMIVGALAVALAVWLGTWLWLRAPARLQWQPRDRRPIPALPREGR